MACTPDARRQATRSPALCRRRGPIGLPRTMVAHIRRVLEASPFHGEGYRKAWAKLRVAGMRTSKERVRRLMRERPPSPAARGPRAWPKAHDGTITTEAPVGHRHDGHRDGRRGGGLRLRGRRSLRDRSRAPPPSVRGPGADPPGHRVRGHARRGPWAAAASRPLELLGRRSTGGRVLRIESSSCGSPKATASRSASSAR